MQASPEGGTLSIDRLIEAREPPVVKTSYFSDILMLLKSHYKKSIGSIWWRTNAM